MVVVDHGPEAAQGEAREIEAQHHELPLETAAIEIHESGFEISMQQGRFIDRPRDSPALEDRAALIQAAAVPVPFWLARYALSSSRYCARKAGCAGQAGPVTNWPSVTASSIGISA